jgi:hypothetical protein
MATSSPVGDDAHVTSRSPIDWFFRDRDTGRLAIVQAPNLPLAVFLVATVVRVVLHPEGAAGTAVSVVGTASLVWWSVDEIARGDSPFRRVLGAVVLAATLAGLLLR